MSSTLFISSTSNSQIKYLIGLQNKSSMRKKDKVFIVEGIKMYKETPKDKIVSVYVSESFEKEHMGELEHYILVSDNVFNQISDTVTPQGILTIVRQKEYKLEKILDNSKKQLFLILENIQDPGNLGTMIRTAEGAGVSAVIMSKNTVDMYNPKVIRSTMGSIYRVPFIISEDLESTIDQIKSNNIQVYAAHLNGKNYFDEENYNSSTAFLIGNEANGLSDEISQKADKLVKIHMCGQVESLNAAIASAILMYEAKKKM